jgi:diguanylate cyclase (GGDEF)-like protein/PAS domain S-box-containing protein
VDKTLINRPEHEVARLDALVRSVPDALITIDARGAIDYLNPAAVELFGYGIEDAVGRPFAALLADAQQKEYAEYLQLHSRREPVPVIDHVREVIGRRHDGSSFAMELVLTNLRPMDQRMLVAIARDIGERKRAEAQLRHEADHDPVTQLLNRNSFERELTRHIEYSSRYGGGGSVMLLDIDNFKYVAETLGTNAGDEMLVILSKLIGSRLRKTDLLARVGGDELAILLHGAGREKALAIAQELLARVREHPFAIRKQPVRVTLSVGIASIDERPLTGAELLAEAEVAMYAAKDAGRDRVVEYTAEGKEEIEERRMWSERVRQATERGLFVLVCQPIADLTNGKISQYELLLRMRGEDGGLVPPAVFLSTAERFGLIQGVDRWVTQQAIRLIAAHRDKGRELLLEVNLSGMTMTDENFASQVERELTASGIDPSRLIFEITETAAVADIDRARKMAHDLTQLGCRFALDDFGAGFASFYYLKHLPINYLKIDGEFVKGLPNSHADQLIVKALVEVCRGFQIKTVAEFVGDEETMDMLRDLGVDFAQGYFIGHPHPVSDLRAEQPEQPVPSA